MAVIVYIVGTILLPITPVQNPVFMAFKGAAQALSFPLSLVLAGIAGFSVLRALFVKNRTKALFNKQTGIESIRQLSWDEFERLIGEYYTRHGYSVAENSQKGADDGVDLYLQKDGENIIVQCKHWKNKVGVPVVREHLGAIAAMNATRGMVVTSGAFTQSAIAFANENNIGLVDGTDLAKHFDRSRVPIDSDGLDTDKDDLMCPLCGSEMVKRTAKKGIKTGQSFLGCAQFPDCRGTRSLQ